MSVSDEPQSAKPKAIANIAAALLRLSSILSYPCLFVSRGFYGF
ncbi:hypothetical protein A79_6047 [Vibrio parahaemolyticus AQ3810]|nr:hypothetical protein A79_6047 [Vibrio parahaemolyticus AQ3810]